MNCPVCNSRNATELPRYNDYEMRRCAVCRFVFAAPRSIPAGIYEQLYGSDHYASLKASAEAAAAGDVRIAWFKREALRLAKGGSLLEVGSGSGTFLIAATAAGFAVQGIETSATAAAVAQRLGVPTYVGEIERYNPEERFGAITMFDVLEHLLDPVAVLKRLRLMLRPGGRLILSVPNVDDPYCLKQPWPIVTPPVHMNFFGRASITRALTEAGLKVDSIKTRLIPTATVKSLYGLRGLALRVPHLLALRAVGKADGSTLLVVAH